jgi:hypothetical protein
MPRQVLRAISSAMGLRLRLAMLSQHAHLQLSLHKQRTIVAALRRTSERRAEPTSLTSVIHDTSLELTYVIPLTNVTRFSPVETSAQRGATFHGNQIPDNSYET